jgi:catechol 2,3-dioxygenase-like lactoylglutathione lyase family enzyme
VNQVGGPGRLSGVALECRDPAALADFYRRLTGWSVVYAHPDWYSIGESEESAFHLSFQRAPGHVPPTWPDPASSMQLHLHFRVDDLEVAEEAVLAMGGTKLDHGSRPESSSVFADPAGHPFCLVPTRESV